MWSKLFVIAFATTLLAGCDTQDEIVTDRPFSPAPHREPNIDKSLMTMALFLANPADPWVQRHEISLNSRAQRLHTNLLVYHDASSEALCADMENAKIHGATGAIVYPPDCRSGNTIVAAANKDKLKLLVIDNPLQLKSEEAANIPTISPDYPQAGRLAAETMLKATKTKPWDMSRAGTIIFISSKFGQSAPIAKAIKSRLVVAGLDPAKFFLVPAEDGSISSARQSASGVLKQNFLVKYWFVGGFTDAAAVGGIRAVEDAHISTGRVIGVGFEGDGAIYDLQRPIMSGLVASILLPAGEIADEAGDEMAKWMKSSHRPTSPTAFTGTVLDRVNVRKLKQNERLIE